MDNHRVIERKCLNCGTWNKGEDFCTNCNAPLSHKEIVKVEIKKKQIEEANKPKDKFDILAEKMKNHRFILVRFAYQILYAIGMLFALLGGFFAYLIALANG